MYFIFNWEEIGDVLVCGQGFTANISAVSPFLSHWR